MHHCKEVLKNVLLPLIKDSAWIFSQSKSSEDVIVFERSGNPSFLNDKIGWHQDWKGDIRILSLSFHKFQYSRHFTKFIMCRGVGTHALALF